MVPVEEVTFFSNGYELAAALHRPRGPASGLAVPAIVVAGGFGGVKELRVPEICSDLAAAGFAALRFDNQGFGRSEGPRWRLLPLEQADNIRDAAAFLATTEGIDPNRIGVYGNGWGGGPALWAAAIDDRLRCVVVTAAPTNGRRWMRAMRSDRDWSAFLGRLDADRLDRVRSGTSTAVPSDEIMLPDRRTNLEHSKSDARITWRARMPLESAQAVIDFAPELVIDRIAPRAVLFIHCERDALVPLAESEAGYARAGEPKRMVVIEGAEHHDIYYPPWRDDAMAEAVNWYEEHLRGKSA
jgi:pimeloyl-ACP methyl ester carboxylesterase